MDEQTLAVLEGARDNLQSGWCQKDWAKTGAGNVIGLEEDNATCFCLWGAVIRAVKNLGIDGHGIYGRILDVFGSIIGPVDPVLWNDLPGRTVQEVLALVSQGIETLKGKLANAV